MARVTAAIARAISCGPFSVAVKLDPPGLATMMFSKSEKLPVVKARSKLAQAF
jgi:hypothetical protein